jgi:hypothetical protein
MPQPRELLVARPEGRPAPERVTPAYTFPEYTTYFPWPGPVIPVRFPDGITAEFRPGSPFPQVAKVHGQGIDIEGLLLDFTVDITPDSTPASLVRPWKTGVSGVDGAEDVAERYREAVLALCQRRAKEARSWLNTALRGQR